MVPLSKKEKRGEKLVIVFLLLPIIMFSISTIISIYYGSLAQYSATDYLMLGGLLGLGSLASFAIYLGKAWAHYLMLLCVSSIFGYRLFLFLPLYGGVFSLTDLLTTQFFYFVFYTLPFYLLFLPAPHSFLTFQREKKARQLAILSHQLNQIGSDE